MDSGTIAFWVLSTMAMAAWLSVVLKLTWWKSTVGYWFFWFVSVVVFLCGFIFTLQIDWWPDTVEDNARAIIYSSLATVLLALVIDIWRKNPHHWSWTKEK